MITPSCFVVMREFLQCALVSWGSSSVSVTFGRRVEGRCCRWGVERRQDGCGVRDVVSMGDSARLIGLQQPSPQSLPGNLSSTAIR